MKISEMFVGQFVQMKRDEKEDSRIIPEVGHVVGLELEYETSTLAKFGNQGRSVGVRPSIQFVGERHPIGVHPSNLEKYRD